jgi:A/G-specific adenine glycosylase
VEERLLEWYRANGRDLPWRRTRDPYAILVSEVMAQQTQVDRVVPRWERWLERWPTVESLAAASTADVIREWQGLGYNRRALALHHAAQQVAAHGWPDDLTDLPGVGRYTAAAVAAQCDDADMIGIEVNVRRVCERVHGARLSTTEAETAAVEIAAPRRGRDRLLALMDVGATICTARNPACDCCPIARDCATRGALPGETKHRQAAYAGSFRERRGRVMARLRAGPVRTAELDGEALASLLDDGLAEVTRGRAHLPRA